MCAMLRQIYNALIRRGHKENKGRALKTKGVKQKINVMNNSLLKLWIAILRIGIHRLTPRQHN